MAAVQARLALVFVAVLFLMGTTTAKSRADDGDDDITSIASSAQNQATSHKVDPELADSSEEGNWGPTHHHRSSHHHQLHQTVRQQASTSSPHKHDSAAGITSAVQLGGSTGSEQKPSAAAASSSSLNDLEKSLISKTVERNKLTSLSHQVLEENEEKIHKEEKAQDLFSIPPEIMKLNPALKVAPMPELTSDIEDAVEGHPHIEPPAPPPHRSDSEAPPNQFEHEHTASSIPHPSGLQHHHRHYTHVQELIPMASPETGRSKASHHNSAAMATSNAIQVSAPAVVRNITRVATASSAGGIAVFQSASDSSKKADSQPKPQVAIPATLERRAPHPQPSDMEKIEQAPASPSPSPSSPASSSPTPSSSLAPSAPPSPSPSPSSSVAPSMVLGVARLNLQQSQAEEDVHKLVTHQAQLQAEAGAQVLLSQTSGTYVSPVKQLQDELAQMTEEMKGLKSRLDNMQSVKKHIKHAPVVLPKRQGYTPVASAKEPRAVKQPKQQPKQQPQQQQQQQQQPNQHAASLTLPTNVTPPQAQSESVKPVSHPPTARRQRHKWAGGDLVTVTAAPSQSN